MFEVVADQGPAGVLAAMTCVLAKLPAELWRTENDGFAAIAEAIDALAVQVDCARVSLVAEAQSRGVVAASPCPSAADWLMAHSLHLPTTSPGTPERPEPTGERRPFAKTHTQGLRALPRIRTPPWPGTWKST
jgi:hypothetical protein